jgi:hypothetical protein
MPARPIQTNFTSGELSEKLAGRVDLRQYANGAFCLKNFVPQSHGGAARRAGSIFIAPTKFQDRVAHLQKFEFGRTQAYELEIGHLYIRFFANRALLRVASTSPAFTLTLAALTGYNITATSSGAYFTDTNTDRGREITFASGGRARILTVTSTTVARVFVLSDFSALSATSGNWTITGVPVEVVTPYVEADVPALRVEQSADVMYIAHTSYPPQKLQRISATSFVLTPYAPRPPPTLEAGYRFATTLTLGALTGTGVTFTAGAAGTFLDADVGRAITAGAGRAIIRSFTSGTQVIVDIVDAFASSPIASGDWVLNGSPITTLSVTAKGPVGAPVTLTAAGVTQITVTPAATLTPAATTGAGVNFTATAAIFSAGDVSKVISGPSGAVATITAFTSTTIVVANISSPFASTMAIPAGFWFLSTQPSAGIAAFRTTLDVGKYVKILGGVVRLTGFSSALIAQGEILKTLDVSGTTFPALAAEGSWTLESNAWSAEFGYPGVVCLSDGRLYWAATLEQPDTLWGSVVGDYENFGTGIGDADSVEIPSGSGGVNEIRWMKRSRVLNFGSIGGEHTLSGPNESPVTPAGPPIIREQSTYGADYFVDALRTANATLFLQRGIRRLREMAFNFEADGYVAPDIALLSEHLLREGGTRMAHVQTPESIVFVVSGNGELLTMTYERSEQIVAWARHITGRAQDLTDGHYESVSAIPNNCGSGDEAWAIVKRTINGATVRYVEAFDGFLNVDSGLTYSGTMSSVFRGLEHLEGETVKVVVGNTTIYTLVVASGAITLPDFVSEAQIGLLFISHLTTMRPEIPTQQGTAQMRAKRWNVAALRLLCTYGNPTVNGQAVEYDAGEATEPFSGDIVMTPPLGWDKAGRITVEQPNPQPCTVLAISGSLQVDDG